jgi:ParB-like nuclease domain
MHAANFANVAGFEGTNGVRFGDMRHARFEDAADLVINRYPEGRERLLADPSQVAEPFACPRQFPTGPEDVHRASISSRLSRRPRRARFHKRSPRTIGQCRNLLPSPGQPFAHIILHPMPPSAANRLDLDPASLELDLENPRLAQNDHTGKPNERDVIEYLAANADVAELIQSISSNGYLDFEPLVVLDEGTAKKPRLIVIEGNRRVAAIKLLHDPELARELGVSVPELSKDVRDSLKKVSAIKVADRDEARQYIGFKHINGPHKWDSFAKAKFAADWYRAERDSGTTLRDIARRLGDRHDTVLRLVQGMFVLEQAQKEGVFEIDDRYQKRPFAFSHLYTALTRPPYRDYLGLDPNWRQAEPTPDPVPKKRTKQLGKVLQWLYGSEQDRVPPVVTSQNPHVKQLGEVLANPMARKKLESGSDLREAYAEVDTRSRKFSDNLLKAVESAQLAQGFVDGYDREPALLEYGERLSKIARTIHSHMKLAIEDKEDAE